VEAFTGKCWYNWVGSTHTDSSGNYAINGLPPVDVYLHAYPEQSNHREEWYDNHDGSTDCDSAMPVNIVPGTPGAVDFVLPPEFSIQGSVMNVRQPDGSFETYYEVVIGDDFVGDPAADIESITITGPDGDVINYPTNNGDSYQYFDQWHDYWFVISGSPAPGVYTFTATSTDAAGTTTDHQYVLRTLPIPDQSAMSPAAGSIVSSKTPSFAWGPLQFTMDRDFPVYYRLEIWDDDGGQLGPNRVFATNRMLDRLYYTIPPGVLIPGEAYWWRIRATDNNDWLRVENRVNSDWIRITVADTLPIHELPPAINPGNWNSVTWTNDGGTGYLCSIRIIDLDGVNSGDHSPNFQVSHTVTVEFPGGSPTHTLIHDGAYSPTSAYYYVYVNGTPPSGSYTFTVTDPDGNTGTHVEDFTSNPLEPPERTSITPSIIDETISATFDNVQVKHTPAGDFEPYDDFSYAHIGELDLSKWQPWYSNVSIVDNALVSTISDSVGRGNGGLAFKYANSLYGIQAEVTVADTISTDDGPPRARIAGYWYHNGNADVWASINVKGTKVYYGLDENYFNENGNIASSAPIDTGALPIDIVPGQTVTISISWDENDNLVFAADGISHSVQIPQPIYPPTFEDKNIQTRINLVTDTTPRFTWNPVEYKNNPGEFANRYRVRIYTYNNSKTIWRGYPSETEYTVPPGVLKPDAYYRFRLEAWDAPSPLNIDNVSKTPASNDDNYRFYTGAEDAVAPYIDLSNHSVYIFTDSAGDNLHFWIKVHDAQGVPGNIKHVKVIHDGGLEEFLEYYGDNQYSPATPTSAIYRLESALPPVAGGTYTFVVEDIDGNTNQVYVGQNPLTEVLTLAPIGYPAAGTLSAAVDGSAVSFDWEDVAGITPDAGIYELQIHSYDHDLLYQFYTSSSEYQLPAGFLEEGKTYRWRITTRREYFSRNVDNMSTGPDYWNMLTFSTGTPADSDEDGIPDYWEELHGLDPDIDDSGLDPDNDGLTNKQEYDNATDPNNPDSDDDGLPDGWEKDNGLNPLSNDAAGDADSDGVINLHEFQGGTDPQSSMSFPDQSQLSVDPINGDDFNIGNGDYPLQTLHGAVERINSLPEANYTINLTPGIYSRPLEADTALAPVHNITINGAGATIDGSGATAWTNGLILGPGVTNATISGLTIQNFKTGILVNSGGGCLNFDDIAVSQCEKGLIIVDSYQATIDLTESSLSGNQIGLHLTSGSSNNVIRNGLVTNNTDGILLESDGETPDDNRFEDIDVTGNTGNGIVIYEGSGNVIFDCRISGNNTGRTAYGGIAVYAGCNEIVDSVIEQNNCYGIWADDALASQPLMAVNNDWGAANGPQHPEQNPAGSGNAVSDHVEFMPWTGYDPVSDDDGDGWPAQAETQAGTDPNDDADYPTMTQFTVGGAGADDNNLGDAGRPLKTLHGAIARINGLPEADYRIEIGSGIYDLDLEADRPLAPVNRVTIVGQDAVIDGNGANSWTKGLTMPAGAAYLKIEGVLIKNFITGIAINSEGGCVTLQNIIIDNCDTGLQLVESYQVELDLSGSTITGNRTGVKVAAGSSNNVIRNGAVVGNDGDGIFVEGETETPDDNFFEGIQIADNAGNGIIFYNGSGNRVTDCLIVGNNRSGSALGGVAVMAGCVVINDNVIEDNQCYGVWADDLLVSSAPVDATDNWWGDESGPGGAAPGSGDAVSEYVDYVPWTGYQEGSGYEPVQQEDADGDGLPDWWEQIIINADDDDDIDTLEDVWANPNCDLTDIRCDFDGDGIRNWDEWRAETDPTKTVAIDITQPAGNPAYFGPSQSTITVSGTSQYATEVDLSINDGDPIGLVPETDGSWSLNDLSLASGLNTIFATAYGLNESVRDSVSVVLDDTAPAISIEIPTADDTYTTSLTSIIIGGVANDNSGIASISWECFNDDILADSGTASGTTSWTTGPVHLTADADNTIIIRARDRFGNTGQAEIVVTTESAVTTADQDLSSESSEPQADPLDLDGDDYLNDDESACGTDPNNGDSNVGGAVPANLTGASYPTDENDSNYDPAKVKRDDNGSIIGAYLWPDCKNQDADFDGLPDVWEQRIISVDDDDIVETLFDVWSGPGCDTADIRCDYDGDGYRHIDEYQNGTDSLIAQVPNFIFAVRDVASGGNYNSWMPEFNAVLEIEAEWDGINPPTQVWFSLKNTTKLPGRAINDPDPTLYGTTYPEWYRYSGYDFGLTVQMATNSYEQGPIQVSDSADGLSDGKYTIYLRCWDYGGRTKIVVGDAAENPTYIAEEWIPKGSGINGLAAAWDYDNNPGTQNPVPVKDLNPAGDLDRVILQNPGAYTNVSGDDIDNLSEYRGIVYRVDNTDTHQRLNPYRKDLFVRAVGFDDAVGDPYRPVDPQYQNAYPFRIGNALKNAGIDVHNVTGWGHEFTADNSFFVYHTAGQASLTSGYQVTGAGTNWATKWPLLEWEFKLAEDPDDDWIPVSFWAGANSLFLYEEYNGNGTEGDYAIRLPLPPINVLIVRLDEVKTGAFSTEDGYIKFVGAIEPGPENPSGSRFWAWATKGKGLKASKEASYGIAEALKIPLDHYFGDRPYQKQTVWENGQWCNADISAGSSDLRLPPLNESEDPTDSGVFIDGYADPALGILLGNSPNGQWDGDRRLATHSEWESAGHLNPFDIDNNGFVELPPATDPRADNSSRQFASYDSVAGWQNGYTKAWVLKHTISHEICHVLAGPLHSEDPNDLMYKYSSNWKRADYLSDWYRSLLMIHNKTR